MQFTFKNVNDAFTGLVSSIYDRRIPTTRKPSRVGEVIQIDEPVLITYLNPRQRVLFNPARDANPFFHLVEAMWMLAGRNDVAPLQFLASNIGEIASDDGLTFNGAYGYRWKQADGGKHESVDQLKVLVDHLRAKPESRRAVLQMWNVEDDLMKLDTAKDVCCNTAVYFAINECRECRECRGEGTISLTGDGAPDEDTCPRCYGLGKQLDMTVTNRSNDLVWGCLGGDYTAFSFLQEYMAEQVGVGVGLYHQFTNNLHVYTERFEPEKWLTGDVDPGIYNRVHYTEKLGSTSPQVDEDLDKVVSNCKEQPGIYLGFNNRFLFGTVNRAIQAFKQHKERDYKTALSTANMIESEDWKWACVRWIERRRIAWEAKCRA